MAADRRKRPSDFLASKAEKGDARSCPFCPGNEDKTPPAVVAYTAEGVVEGEAAREARDWQIRVIPNLYAAMVPQPAPPTLQWVALPGHGSHEVIIDSPDHWTSAAEFSVERLDLLLSVYRDRYSYYCGMNDVRYIAIFKNRGEAAGASLAHTHSQVVALPIIPPLIKREVEASSEASFCLYCNVIEREAASERLISRNDSWILIAPFYSQAPYETWILPRAHISNLDEMTEAQRMDLARMIKDALMRNSSLLNDPPFNLEIFQMPYDYHMNIRIQPAISKTAGFERGTGVYLNPVPPEQAAAELRLMQKTEKLNNQQHLKPL
ncbi:MAG TPA: DUF4921 family protein [Methanotrichaceae archaeon]|nr:DUF4921 family protein [Methanotrichaceae archaeon]